MPSRASATPRPGLLLPLAAAGLVAASLAAGWWLGQRSGGAGGGDRSRAALERQVEQLHRRLQDGPFRQSLPEDRNRLFELLEEMERSGGWPYIPRLQLRTFMDLLQPNGAQDTLAA